VSFAPATLFGPAESDVPLPVAWEIRGARLAVGGPVIMAILNVTPDSFSDAGEAFAPGAAVERAWARVESGAHILDVGGESTRPGADPVPPEEEIRRVVPTIRRLAAELPVPISVDTRKASVARAALDAGAAVVNDVSALADPEMAPAVAEAGAGVVLMHMRGVPSTMQTLARYCDVAEEVAAELGPALARALAAGVPRERIVLDPGLGFAKNAEHNLRLLGTLAPLLALGRPVMVGPSRKSFLGAVLDGAPPAARDVATAAACALAYAAGARVFRVHDVGAARDALAVAEAVGRAAAGAG
jgi:dihydropteroate synthase